MTAILSGGPSLAGKLVTEGAKSLLAQSTAVTDTLQADGWGAAFFPPKASKPAVFKSPKPVFTEKNRFAGIFSQARRGLVLAHIRQASNPGDLSRAALLGAVNTQPFCGNGFAFAHNGVLEIPNEIKAHLGKYARMCKGVNDSEVLFWQVMKMLDAYGDPVTALEMAIDEIQTIWLSCRDRYPKKRSPYGLMNIFLSNGRELWALCHYPEKMRKTAFMTQGWHLGSIAWRSEKGRIIFSSEPLDTGHWNKMPNRTIAHAALKDPGVTVKLTRIAR